jgi:hypothetical protein
VTFIAPDATRAPPVSGGSGPKRTNVRVVLLP